MEYEIANPSDMCFVSHDEPAVVAATVTLLGNGMYPCGKLPTLYMFGGDPDTQFKEQFGVTLKEMVEDKEYCRKIADCFDSFRYASERSSMNNIGERAKQFAGAFKKKAEKLALTIAEKV